MENTDFLHSNHINFFAMNCHGQ